MVLKGNRPRLIHNLYESNVIKKGIQEFKIIVKKKPNFIAIDPYGTRSDENLVDNIRDL